MQEIDGASAGSASVAVHAPADTDEVVDRANPSAGGMDADTPAGREPTHPTGFPAGPAGTCRLEDPGAADPGMTPASP